ncbi:hypothetical protein L3Q82_006368 [Scortum barcoo]|uniref:Uncharacterized protein n=1 Tax=Scortum barcoo TaxID=214431 RepID=A0ACB8WZF8_9TELE|nr:hypothetical protein L3Q82_006368 [Scortum barcoo]
MDKGLTHEKLLKTEQEKHLALRQGVVANQWDSVESDTESLAQEKAYQQQLKMCIGHSDQNKYILPQKENVDTLYHGDGEDEDVNDDETDPQVYDSLEVTAHPHDKKNPTLLHTEYLDTQIDKSKGTRQLLSDDAYSDLRYDPNWRINLKGAGCFTENPQMSMEEYYHPKEKANSSVKVSQTGLPLKQVHETFKKEASTESQANSSDPKQRWLQKTPQLRVTQISKGKKTQQKDYPNPPHQQQTPPVLGVRAEQGDCLTSPLARPAAETQPKPQNTTSLQPIPPTIHLNINLNTSSHLLPLLQQKGQDAIISLASLHGFPHWSFAPEGELGLSPGHQQTNPGKSSQMSWKGLHHRNLERSPEQCQRTAALKWPLSCEGEVQKWNPNEIHTKQFPQNLLRSPTTTSPLCSGSYTVLPSIGQPMTGNEPEQSPGQSVSTAIHRSGSDGYLVQMEKQKQLRARVTYKAYSLKDYKQLKSDINLQGLGPDYTAIEKTALEYAKTIAKPPVQSQPKRRQKHQSEGFTERTPYMEDLDGTQLATLEVLRRRHEEEKQAVALFRKVYAI